MSPKEIREKRLALELSISELADEVGIPARELRSIEAGDLLVEDPAAFERTFARLFAQRQRSDGGQ